MLKITLEKKYSLIKHILHDTARNSYFKDDCFLLLC